MNLRMLSLAEVMARTGFKRSKVYKLIHSGDLRYIKGEGPNGHFHIFENSLEEYFIAQAKGKPSDAPSSAAPTVMDGDDALPFVAEPVFS